MNFKKALIIALLLLVIGQFVKTSGIIDKKCWFFNSFYR